MENSKPTIMLTGNTGAQELEKAIVEAVALKTLASNPPKVAVCVSKEEHFKTQQSFEFKLNNPVLPLYSSSSETQQRKCAKGLHTYTEIASDGQNPSFVKLKCIYCGTIK
jgi:uncharacterized alpha/beta hydrolase family protein